MIFRAALLMTAVLFSFSALPGSEALSLDNEAALSQGSGLFASTEANTTTLPQGDEILIRSDTPQQEEEIMVRSNAPDEPYLPAQPLSLLVSTGAVLPIYDEDFRDFLDYGASVSIGLKKPVSRNFSLVPAIGLIYLTGDFKKGDDRDIINVELEEWFPGYTSNPNDPITAEDVDDVNLGFSVRGEGEAVITSTEVLRSLKLDTDLYIIPLTVNALYRLPGLVKNITPYVGAGIGVCMARREVEGSAVKGVDNDAQFYRISLDDSQTVYGQVFNLLAGFEIPFKNNLKIVAEASTSLYGLNDFDPVLTIEYRDPVALEGEDIYTRETPREIGVYDDEFITSLSIGIVWPF